MKEKTAATVEAMKETAAESADIVKKNAHIALDKTGKVMEDAACVVLKGVDNAKESAAYIKGEAQKHIPETVEIVKKNADIAKESVMSTANSAIHKGQEGVAYAKGVTEGVVGAAKGSSSHEEIDLHTISRPAPTGTSGAVEAPHVSE